MIRAAGVNSNFQAIASGVMPCVFIVLQSGVLWPRGKDRFKLALPSWPPRRRAASGE